MGVFIDAAGADEGGAGERGKARFPAVVSTAAIENAAVVWPLGKDKLPPSGLSR